jgi:hypothetical protein
MVVREPGFQNIAFAGGAVLLFGFLGQKGDILV